MRTHLLLASLLTFCSVLSLIAPSVVRADEPTTLDVWPGLAPGETASNPDQIQKRPDLTLITNVTKPTLTVMRPPKDIDSGAAVIINPGGGYGVLAYDLEGTEIAQWLNSIGVTGIVLHYRVPARPNQPRWQAPLQDAQRAMSLVRSKADEWKIDPKRIGMLGFSAGGNLTGVASTHFNERAYPAIDDVDKVSCRPDFSVFVYAAWLNNDKQETLAPEIKVTKDCPVSFFSHANDDPIDCESSITMFQALKHAGVKGCELHIFASGGHGYGMRHGIPAAGWPRLCADWMKDQKIINKLPEAPVKPEQK